MRKLIGGFSLLALFSSCQKEIDWGWSDSSNGDLLVRAVEVTPSTNDTNVITFSYDSQRRLVQYQSAGKVNGIQTNIKYVFSRQSDGRIGRIHAQSSVTAGFIDSTVYFPVYNGNKLFYVIDTQYSSLVDIRDSTAYIYNGLNQCTEIVKYTDLFGTMEPLTRQTLVYDATGNPVSEILNASDGSGGWDLVSTTTYTYNAHKSAVTLGDESYIVLPASNVSKNECVKQEVISLVGGNYTFTMTGQTYNSNDRPKKASISFTPQPPGYDTNVTYFYQ